MRRSIVRPFLATAFLGILAGCGSGADDPAKALAAFSGAMNGGKQFFFTPTSPQGGSVTGEQKSEPIQPTPVSPSPTEPVGPPPFPDEMRREAARAEIQYGAQLARGQGFDCSSMNPPSSSSIGIACQKNSLACSSMGIYQVTCSPGVGETLAIACGGKAYQFQSGSLTYQMGYQGQSFSFALAVAAGMQVDNGGFKPFECGLSFTINFTTTVSLRVDESGFACKWGDQTFSAQDIQSALEGAGGCN